MAAVVPVGIEPRGVGVNVSTNRIYVCNNGGFAVSVIDGASDTVVETVPVGIALTTVALHPGTDRVYVAVGGQNEVAVIARD